MAFFKTQQRRLLEEKGLWISLTSKMRKNLLQKILSDFAKDQFYYTRHINNYVTRSVELILESIIPPIDEKMDWGKEDLERFIRLSKLSAYDVAVVSFYMCNKYMPEEKFYPHSGMLYLAEEIIENWMKKNFKEISEADAWLAISAYANSDQFADDFMTKFNKLAEELS